MSLEKRKMVKKEAKEIRKKLENHDELRLDILFTALFEELAKETKKSDKLNRGVVDQKIVEIFNHYFINYGRDIYIMTYEGSKDSLLN